MLYGRSALPRLAWIVGVLATAGCCGSPSLAYFRATPRRFCPKTQAIKVEWFSDAKSVTLASKELTGLGEKGGHGSLSIAPKAGTLHLDYGNGTDEPVKRIVPMVAESPLVGERAAFCRDGVSVAEVSFDPEEYAAEVVVKSVKNRLDDRPVTVIHLGRTLEIPAGGEAPLPELEAGDPTVRTAHAWTIRVPLLEGETCGSKRVIHPGVVMNMECAP